MFEVNDRVISWNGIPATVKSTPLSRLGDPRFVYMNVDGNDDAYCNEHREKLKRQPIEVGCYVRVLPLKRIRKQFHGKVFKVQEIPGNYVFVGNGIDAYWFGLDALARVAEPTVGIFMGSDGFKVVLPDGATFRTPTEAERNLKHAQELAKAIHTKHFTSETSDWKVADDLQDVLLQLENMTAGMVKQTQDAAIKLAQNVQDLAQELQHARQGIAEAATMFGSNVPYPSNMQTAWLAKYAPKTAFKRGDMVTWGAGQIEGYIVGIEDEIEILIVGNIGGKPNKLIAGSFTKQPASEIRHVSAE